MCCPFINKEDVLKGFQETVTDSQRSDPIQKKNSDPLINPDDRGAPARWDQLHGNLQCERRIVFPRKTFSPFQFD